MTTHLRMFRRGVVVLSLSLFVTGCASFSGTTPRAVVFQSYDLPSTLEANAVIRAVERAFARTLSKPPRIVEGSVPSALPVMPAPFTVEERRVHLERLGVVTIHEVGCPGSLASVHAWVADRSESSTPHRYTGCIQLYAGAYRVQLIDSRLVLKRGHDHFGSEEIRLKSHPNLLPRLAQAFLEQLTEAREVTDSDTVESFPSDRQAYERASIHSYRSDGERVPSFSASSEKPAENLLPNGMGQEVITTSPLVCLAPRYEAAAVKTQHGGGKVIHILEQGSVMAVAEPLDAAYFRVKTTEGLAGWVKSSEVRRLLCPIG